MLIEWTNCFYPNHEGWYGLGFAYNYPNLGAGGIVIAGSNPLHLLTLISVGM